MKTHMAYAAAVSLVLICGCISGDDGAPTTTLKTRATTTTAAEPATTTSTDTTLKEEATTSTTAPKSEGAVLYDAAAEASANGDWESCTNISFEALQAFKGTKEAYRLTDTQELYRKCLASLPADLTPEGKAQRDYEKAGVYLTERDCGNSQFYAQRANDAYLKLLDDARAREDGLGQLERVETVRWGQEASKTRTLLEEIQKQCHT
jgi:hypothetical protein